MSNGLLYQLLWENPDKPSSLNEAQWGAIKGQARELTPDKGKVWTTKLSDKGLEAYRNLNPEAEGRDGGASDTLTDEQKLDFLITTTREQERNRIYNKRRAENAKRYKDELDAIPAILSSEEAENRYKKNIKDAKVLRPEETFSKPLQPSKTEILAQQLSPEEVLILERGTDIEKMKHYNQTLRNQISELRKQRQVFSSKYDDPATAPREKEGLWAKIEALDKQISSLNGKMYDGERAFKEFSESDETKENQLTLHNLYKNLTLPNISDEQREEISRQIKSLEGKVNQHSALKHWISNREKEINDARSFVKKKIDSESEVKDGDRELEEAVNNATRGFFKQEQVKGDTALTRAQGRMIKKYKEKINSGDYRGAQVILEQHPDIAKKVGYDPVAQRKFNRRKNSENKVRKFAEREKAAYGTEFSEDMIKLATEARAKNPGMTAKAALESARNQMLGIKTNTGRTFVPPEDNKKAARKFTKKNASLKAEADGYKKQFDFMADKIGKAVKAGSITPQQGQALLGEAKRQYNTSVNTLARKNSKQLSATPNSQTSARGLSVDDAVGNLLATQNAELLNDYGKLDKADQAAIFVQNGGDFKKLPQEYRDALIDKFGYSDVTQSSDFYDKDGNGELSDEEAKAANLRVRTTFDKDGNPTRSFHAQTIDFDNLDSGGVKSFFTRGDEQLDKLRRFTRLAPQQTALFSKQYAAEQKQELANNIYKQKLESEQRKNTYKTHRNIAEDVLKKAQASYSNDYNVKYTEADIDKIVALIEEAKKQGKTLTQSDIVKMGKALVAKNNEPFLYGRAPNGVSQDVYHRLASTLGSQYVNADENTKLALGQRFAQKTPELDKALELLRSNDKEKKKQGLNLLRKLDSDWAKQSKGKDSEIMHPFRDDIYKFETDLLNEELGGIAKDNTGRKSIELKNWVDFVANKKGADRISALHDFAKKYGAAVRTRGNSNDVFSDFEIEGYSPYHRKNASADLFNQIILPMIVRYEQIQQDLENRRAWSEKLARKKDF